MAANVMTGGLRQELGTWGREHWDLSAVMAPWGLVWSAWEGWEHFFFQWFIIFSHCYFKSFFQIDWKKRVSEYLDVLVVCCVFIVVYHIFHTMTWISNTICLLSYFSILSIFVFSYLITMFFQRYWKNVWACMNCTVVEFFRLLLILFFFPFSLTF